MVASVGGIFGFETHLEKFQVELGLEESEVSGLNVDSCTAMMNFFFVVSNILDGFVPDVMNMHQVSLSPIPQLSILA